MTTKVLKQSISNTDQLSQSFLKYYPKWLFWSMIYVALWFYKI